MAHNHNNHKFAYVDSADFNDSKVRLQMQFNNVAGTTTASTLMNNKEHGFGGTVDLMNNGLVVPNHQCHTLVLGKKGQNGLVNAATGANNPPGVGPPYLHHTFSRRQHQLQHHY